MRLNTTTNSSHLQAKKNFAIISTMSQFLVFITGSTGFIGSHVVLQTLDAGYKVRLSVRKESQIEGLKKLFSNHINNVDFVVIPDLSISSAFDSALKDVEYVFHLASPMPGKGNDFKKEYLGPAVQGTTAILDAAKKVSTIKRVVIVSSMLALVPLDALVTGKMSAKGTSLFHKTDLVVLVCDQVVNKYLTLNPFSFCRRAKPYYCRGSRHGVPRGPHGKRRTEIPRFEDPSPSGHP
jgi:UDP-glucose 4-epimerase